jgi:hypothetical protein
MGLNGLLQGELKLLKKMFDPEALNCCFFLNTSFSYKTICIEKNRDSAQCGIISPTFRRDLLPPFS